MNKGVKTMFKKLTYLVVSIVILCSFVYSQTKVQPYILKAKTPLTIDGKLMDWSFCYKFDLNANSIPTASVNRGWAVPPRDNISGTYMFQYDSKYLYFAANLIDDVPGVNIQVGSSGMWMGDCLEFYFGNYPADTTKSGRGHAFWADGSATYKGEMDIHLTVGYTNKGVGQITLYQPFGDGTRFWDPIKLKDMVVIIDDNLVTIEGRIPLDSLSTDKGYKFGVPKDGMIMPFTCQIYDVDKYKADNTVDYCNNDMSKPEGFKLLNIGPYGAPGDAPSNWATPIKALAYRDLETKMVRDPKDSTKLVLDTTHYYIPSEPYIFKAPATPAIDGKLTEWNFCFPISFNSISCPNKKLNRGWAIPKEDNISGSIMFMYDDKYIYWAADLIDDVPGINSQVGKSGMWMGDCIELYFGNYDVSKTSYKPDHTGLSDGSPEAGNKMDVHLTFGYTNKGAAQLTFYQPFGDGTRFYDLIKAKDAAFIIDDNHVTIEGRIPWDSLVTDKGYKFNKPAVGTTMPCAIQLYDVDKYTTDGSVTYFGDNNTNPEGFKLLCPITSGVTDASNWSIDLRVMNAYNPTTAVRELSTVNVPKTYEISNYPNPFNPTTNIKFSVPVSGPVTLKVYNIMGQEVSTLINAYMKAGSYLATFDAKGLASGTYTYILQSRDHSVSGKMLLMK
jgi:hypothetical protein